MATVATSGDSPEIKLSGGNVGGAIRIGSPLASEENASHRRGKGKQNRDLPLEYLRPQEEHQNERPERKPAVQAERNNACTDDQHRNHHSEVIRAGVSIMRSATLPSI